MRSKVDFPAPFGPTTAVIFPGSNFKLTPSTAVSGAESLDHVIQTQSHVFSIRYEFIGKNALEVSLLHIRFTIVRVFLCEMFFPVVYL